MVTALKTIKLGQTQSDWVGDWGEMTLMLTPELQEGASCAD